MSVLFLLVLNLLISSQSGITQNLPIVFYSDRTGNSEIFIQYPGKDEPINLTNNPSQDNCPAVSPDGKRIAFLSDRSGIQNIFLMEKNGNNVIQITKSDVVIQHPSWSPDGKTIFYVKDYQTRTEVWVMNADGSNPKRLTVNQSRDVRPFLSPDGSRVLFMSNRNGRFEAYTMDTNGRNQHMIKNNPDQHIIFPVWSPDGKKIAYSLNNMENLTAEIHIMKSDGTGDLKITNPGGRNENPCWSPDGKSITFQSERDGNFEIYILNIETKDQKRITNSSGWDGWPNFMSVELEK